MNRTGWPRPALALSIALAATLLGSSAGAAVQPKKPVEAFGKGPAYKALARFQVMHAGRIKPIDTLAREEIKQIHGRERISLLDGEENVSATWEPVAALFDWWARPEYWDEQPIIKVEYLPLKRALLRDGIVVTLAEIAAKPTTTAEDRDAIGAVIALQEIGAAELKPLLLRKSIPEADSLAIARLVGRVGEGHKWLSPNQLEDGQVKVDGKPVPFAEWVRSIDARKREAGEMGDAKLTELERRGVEASHALDIYHDLRNRGMSGNLPILVVPRPDNAIYIAFSATAMQNSGGKRKDDLKPLEVDSIFYLGKFLTELGEKDRALPGRGDSAYDAKYAAFLRDKSGWVALPSLLDATPEELAAAGFPASKVSPFQAAFAGVIAAEKANPGKITDPAVTTALIASARELGTALNADKYLTERQVDREVGFNASAPFFYAPFGYGLAAVLLALCLTVRTARSAPVVAVRKGLYAGGLAAFLGAVGLEVYGFSQRVLISGWAPVTNMYETVIWVAMVTSILGLALEGIYRRVYPLLAAAGVATVCTALAVTAPMLDPSIHGLNPVLRSNLWLTIHVLTIVSSYAAFALAMGLGLIATGYYLTTIYRRTASYLELGFPIVGGAILFVAGLPIFLASMDLMTLGDWAKTDQAYYLTLIPLDLGGFLVATGVVAMVGEAVCRSIYRKTLAQARVTPLERPTRVATVDPRELVEAGGPLPPIAGGSPEADDPRMLAMRETAATVKPLSNFIYRAMQVGVLLVAAGTILGGVWADYSWGRFWGWDPKEVWALITLLVYLIPLHGRFAGWVNTFGLVVASVVCFLSVLMAWYGVNSVLGVGLHAYGFVEGGSQGIVGVTTLGVLAIPAGTAWRRFLSQRGGSFA